ncbi:MAG: formylglycine-generating enzyme family protein [Pirellulales bacterium]|nr:formylglycine-generating enzyme family protein [Pirellulales bacterium]
MNRVLPLVLLGALLCAPQFASAVTIDWVTVGESGNAPDPLTGFGQVNQSYRIAKYDVTMSQYADFLNSNDPTGANKLGLYNLKMSISNFGNIQFDAGAANGSKYSVTAGAEKYPTNYITWYSALRFANWINNGQIPGSTETGAYVLLGGTPTPSNSYTIARSANAVVFLPSENEWYKAAYYDPSTKLYFRYPTSSNSAPTATGPTSSPNSANFYNPSGPNQPTDVGAYTGTTSPYGAYDMAGNIWQWNEALIGRFDRGVRGGAFLISTSDDLLSTFRGGSTPAFELAYVGFRVAAVIPEPSTGVMAAIGCCVLCLLQMRFRKR